MREGRGVWGRKVERDVEREGEGEGESKGGLRRHRAPTYTTNTSQKRGGDTGGSQDQSVAGSDPCSTKPPMRPHQSERTIRSNGTQDAPRGASRKFRAAFHSTSEPSSNSTDGPQPEFSTEKRIASAKRPVESVSARQAARPERNMASTGALRLVRGEQGQRPRGVSS